MGHFLSKIKRSKKLSLLAIVLLIAAIPTTVFLSQKHLDIRQHADSYPLSITIHPTTVNPGASVSAQWNITASMAPTVTTTTSHMPTLAFVFTGESNSGGLGANPSATAEELAPTSSVQILNNYSLTFQDLDIGFNNLTDHAGLDPNASNVAHGFELQLANSVKAGAFPQNPQVYLIKTGQGGSGIATWNEGGAFWSKFLDRIGIAKATIPQPIQWVVWYSLGVNDHLAGTPVETFKAGTMNHIQKIKAQLPGAIIIMTQFQAMGSGPSDFAEYNNVLADIAANEPNVYVVDTTGAEMSPGDVSHFSYAGLKTVGAKMVAITNTALDALYPSPTPLSVSPSTKPDILTGAETLQLVRKNDTKIVGVRRFLNCRPLSLLNRSIPPSTPVSSGSCSVTLAENILPGKYLFRIFASDGTTILGESNEFTVNQISMTAYPNPCILNVQGLCTSTLSWSAENQTDVQIRVKENPNVIFSYNAHGSIQIDWITANGGTFQLYAGSTLLKEILIKGIPKPTQ